MATISSLSFTEKVILPFCVLIPIVVGFLGYAIWKRDKHSMEETMSRRMSMWFMASCAAMIGLSIFHVVRNLMAASDYRIGMTAMGITVIVCMCASMKLDILKITDDRDLLLNSKNEVADFVLLDNDNVETFGPELTETRGNIRRRYLVAALVYLVLVFQSAFDGLVLKYNPNAQNSGVQVAMFYLTKLPESVVVSTALIHAAVRTKWYVLYMCNFTMAVGLSTIAAYGTVNPLLIAAIYEHWAFQCILGGSGGLLLTLSYYFSHLESRRAAVVDQFGANVWANMAAFSVSFVLCCTTGMFG